MSTSVLHISPHYGGGVGTVIRSLIEEQGDDEFEHRLLAFESINEQTISWCQQKNIKHFSNAVKDLKKVNQWLESADIVHLHWWNHPLLMQWMSSRVTTPFRCILWSHVNGIHAPQVFFKSLFDYPDLFVFASGYSAESPYAKQFSQKTRIVQSQSKVEVVDVLSKQNHSQFTIGYIGTVDNIKMHPDFIGLCENAQIADAKFIVCGGPKHGLLQQQVEKAGLTSSFEIRGVVSNVSEVLAELDVFGYPLNPEHYGTGEQVILEAMGAGVVPVVLDSGCEKYIIDDGHNGIIASTEAEYSAALAYLCQYPDELQRMSANCIKKIEALQHQQNGNVWGKLYHELLEQDKKRHTLSMDQDLLSLSEGGRLFIQSYGLSPIIRKIKDMLDKSKKFNFFDIPAGILSKTRGSPYHYLSFFPEDPILQEICNYLDVRQTEESSL